MSKSKEIKHKIKSIQSTKKITSAMQLLAASKMKKAQGKMQASRPFASTISKLIANVARNSNHEHVFFINRPETNIGILVIGTDRGLCGGLNINLFKKVWDKIQTWQQECLATVKIATIGERSKDFFGKKLNLELLASYERIDENPKIQDLIGVIQVLLQEYQNCTIDSLYLAYNEFHTTMRQEPIIKQLLPIKPKDLNISNSRLPTEYLFEPNAVTLLDLLLIRYLESLIYQGVVENLASEQSARMLAMQTATDNAEKMISDLHLKYNKERQAIITAEIAEIAAGGVEI